MLQSNGEMLMECKVMVYEAEEGGYWIKASSIPECATQVNMPGITSSPHP
jgi:hypothetical protein